MAKEISKKSIILISLAVYLLLAVLLKDSFSTIKNFDSYLIISSFVALLIALLLFNMKYALFVLLILRPITENFTLINYPIPIINQPLNFTSIISALIIVAGLLYLLINRSPITKYPLSKQFFAFVGIAFLSSLFSSNFSASFEEWLKMFSVFVVFLVATNLITSKKDLLQLIGAIVISMVAPVSVALYQIFAGKGDPYTKGFIRVYGTFTHPITLAYYVLLVSVVIIVLSIETRNRYLKMLAYISFIPIGVVFINTFARGAWIIFVVVLFILGIIRYKRFLIILPILLVIMALFFGTVTTRFADLSKTANNEAGSVNSIESRQDIWKQNIPLVLANPVFGNGIGASYRLINQDTHNDYLRILAEAGVLGLLAYLWLLLITVKSSWKRYKESDDEDTKNIALVFFVMAVAYVILSFDSNVLINGAFQWTFWSLAAAANGSKIQPATLVSNQL